MKNTVYMEEMDAFTYRDKLAQEAVMFIPVGALEQHGSHMAKMCIRDRFINAQKKPEKTLSYVKALMLQRLVRSQT